MAINEQRKIEICTKLTQFLNDPKAVEYEFSSDLSISERTLIHKQCQQLGLKSKSRGGANRYLSVYKQKKLNDICGSSDASSIPEVRMSENLLNEIREYFERLPLSRKDRSTGDEASFLGSMSDSRYFPNGPGYPPDPNWNQVPDKIVQTKRNLPIQASRDEFLDRCGKSQVMLVRGETGSGKSTQIPQFILDNAKATFNPCRIIVAEPRRIAATTLAERVAAERGEKLGDCVGYQIRLESRSSTRTLLTFCTNGVLLKTIVSEPTFFNTVTHIIIDEVHERDKFSDFLLIILREALPAYPSLRIILMSASIEKELLERYFNDYMFLDVPGRAYSVENYFLADILFMTNYTNVLAQQRKQDKQSSMAFMGVASNSASLIETGESTIAALMATRKSLKIVEREEQNGGTTEDFDSALELAWNGDQDAFLHMLDCILAGVIDKNYHDSILHTTLLMVAAGLGRTDDVRTLLERGANPQLTSSNGWQALHWAKGFGNEECFNLLQPFTTYQSVVDLYHTMVDDDQVDIGLVLETLIYVYENMPEGAVLIFLPGYEDILQVKEAINSDQRFDKSKLFLCMLHSQMRGYEQYRAFDPVPQGQRKIVLSTNVAEVSITIDDICYVIDTGKMKQRCYDSVNDVSAIATTWISKTNVMQRTGRAGRCRDGICFHLYSDLRYSSMPDSAVPEILRVPIHELCLQTKLFKPELRSVTEFLMKAPDPPSAALVRSSIELLKTVGAFDVEERLTALGKCLSELPVDPQIGKMILYGAMLQCLDPVLTIAASLSYGDPFILPRERFLTDKAMQRRFQFGEGKPYSDHAVLLHAFIGWEAERKKKQERKFAFENFLSNAAMEMIVGIKGLLQRHLEALGFGHGLLSHKEFTDYFNKYSDRWPVIRAALVAGTYPSVALVDRSNSKLMMKNEFGYLNTSSVLLCRDGARVTRETRSRALDLFPTDWVIYNEMYRQNSTMQVKCATAVDSLTLALFAGNFNTPLNLTVGRIVNTDNECWDSADDGIEIRKISVLNIDEWLKVRMETNAASQLVTIRKKLHALFQKQLGSPLERISKEDEELLDLAIRLLCEVE